MHVLFRTAGAGRPPSAGDGGEPAPSVHAGLGGDDVGAHLRGEPAARGWSCSCTRVAPASGRDGESTADERAAAAATPRGASLVQVFLYAEAEAALLHDLLLPSRDIDLFIIIYNNLFFIYLFIYSLHVYFDY